MSVCTALICIELVCIELVNIAFEERSLHAAGFTRININCQFHILPVLIYLTLPVFKPQTLPKDEIR